MRLAALALAGLLLGCASPDKPRVERFEGQSLNGLKRVGVLPFTDTRGKGREISQAVLAGLAPLFYEPADGAVVERALKTYPPDKEMGLSLGALETLRHEAGADAIVLGHVEADWSAAGFTVYETELGDPVLRAVIKPRGLKRKHFDKADEIAAEVLRVLADRR